MNHRFGIAALVLALCASLAFHSAALLVTTTHHDQTRARASAAPAQVLPAYHLHF